MNTYKRSGFTSDFFQIVISIQLHVFYYPPFLSTGVKVRTYLYLQLTCFNKIQKPSLVSPHKILFVRNFHMISMYDDVWFR